MSTLALRISCPDRPDALGAVATALGRAGTNIVSLDVVERAAGVAIDDLVVVGRGAGAVVDAVESVPGVVVEFVHAVAPATDPVSPLDPLDVAARLVGTAGDMYRELMGGSPTRSLPGGVSWCRRVRPSRGSSPGAPRRPRSSGPARPGCPSKRHAGWMQARGCPTAGRSTRGRRRSLWRHWSTILWRFSSRDRAGRAS